MDYYLLLIYVDLTNAYSRVTGSGKKQYILLDTMTRIQ